MKRVAVARPRARKKARPFALHRALPSFFKPGAMDLVFLSRQLGVFLRAGVPLVPAVEALAEQSANPTLRDALFVVRDDLVTGHTLSSALAREPRVFPRLYSDMVRAGEATGKLEVVLKQVADQLERGASARRRLFAAMLYPALVVLLALLVVVMMTVLVLPAMAGLFKEFEAELPLPTRIVLAAANFVSDWGLASSAALAALAVLAFLFSRTAAGGRFFDRVVLNVPVVGGIARDAIVERTARTLGTLLAAGVPLVETVELVRDTTGNSLYRRHFDHVRRCMLRGEGFAEPFASTNLFPPLVRQMAKVGERAGTLDQFLREVADYYTGELELKIETALRLMEPALTMLVAAIVGLVALSVITPIYSLIGNIK